MLIPDRVHPARNSHATVGPHGGRAGHGAVRLAPTGSEVVVRPPSHRRSQPSRWPLRLLAAVGIATLLIVGWVWLRPHPIVRVRLSPSARRAVLAALQVDGFTVARTLTGGTAVYALDGTPRQPGQIAFLASRPGAPAVLYAATLDWSERAMPWTIGPTRVMAGSATVAVSTLNGFGGSLFYALAVDGQTETLVVRDLTDQRTQIYFFAGPAHAVQIVPHGSAPIRMAVVHWQDRAGAFHQAILWHGPSGWQSLSPSLTIPPVTPDRTALFVRLVELTRRWLGPTPVALAENSWFTAVDRLRRAFGEPGSGVRRARLAGSSPAVRHAVQPDPTPTVLRGVISKVRRGALYPAAQPTPTVTRRPADVVIPVAWPRVPGEGVWRPAGRQVAGHVVMERTFVLPDPNRPYARVDLVWIDRRRVDFHLVAGTHHPRAPSGLRGTGMIPRAARPRLLAAFNGGFKRMGRSYHGFGFRASGEWFVLPTPGLATLAIGRTHHPALGAWGREIPSTPPLDALLQNLPLLIDHGQISPRIARQQSWGITVGNAVRVWRSGLGQTATSDLIYAAGPSLTARSLARALVAAGARRGMELDINSYWVTFNFYSPIAPRSSQVQGQKLIPAMTRSATRYLRPDRRSFVYLTAAQPPAMPTMPR